MEHADFLSALERMGLISAGETPAVTPLTGGVSSDIVRVDLPNGPVCIKRALPQLKVEADWQAPVERNDWERAWMKVAASIVPEAVPRIVGEDSQSGMFAMEYLDPESYPVWKEQLRDGTIETGTATRVGQTIAAIHGATAGRNHIEQAFRTDHIFVPIRLDPYLRATAEKHPECAGRLEDLAARTATTKIALVHGDVSPKNILIGAAGPVFLDAECAWYGDPAFDVAFCLNHLLLKCIWRPQWTGNYLACFDSLVAAYLGQVKWESADALERRAAALLPGLLLGRVDGKSPVEYVTRDTEREQIRRTAVRLLQEPVERLADLRNAWESDLAAASK
ncbi:MAG: aminoglycoside phosphotransferase family protein [Burkholderiales bacterium]|jgi:aminoglycoside phosphotransferase (APT) family kinase protein